MNDLVGVQVVQPPSHIQCHQPSPVAPLEVSSMPHPGITQVAALQTQIEIGRATRGQKEAGDAQIIGSGNDLCPEQTREEAAKAVSLPNSCQSQVCTIRQRAKS